MFKNLFKKENKEEIGFEPEEQKTPLLGKILLLILAIVLIIFGTTGTNDIKKIPKKPENLSTCSGIYSYGNKIDKNILKNISILDRYYFYSSQEKACNFSSYEVKNQIPEIYSQIIIISKEINDYRNNVIAPLQNKLDVIKLDIEKKQKDYDLSLQEVQAGQPHSYKSPLELSSELQNLREQERQLSYQLGNAKNELIKKENILKEKGGLFREKLEKVIELYNRDWMKYELKVFILELLFIFPLFILSLYFYFKFLKTNSPYTIILLPIIFASGVLVAKSIIFYFWYAFLAELIVFILNLTGLLAIFKFILFYLGMGISILIFGGSVYLLQKKIFSPNRVKIRRLKANKCPYCETPFEFTKKFCAGCGKQLLEQCPNCGQDKFTDFKYCPVCGK